MPADTMVPTDEMVKKLVASIAGAGPDAYDRASSNTVDAKRALLDAVASGGSAGRAEYERQAAQAAASKQTALQAALAAASGRGAPQATLDAVAAQIARPYDEAGSARDAASANWQNYYTATGVNGGAYLDRLSAAIPMMQQQSRNSLAVGLNHDYQDAAAKQLTAKDQLALQLAQLQSQVNQRWADQEISAANLRTQQQREDAQRAEDWQHTLALRASSGGGGGGSGGGGSGKAAAAPKSGYDLAMNKLTALIGAGAYEADQSDPWYTGDQYGPNGARAVIDDTATMNRRLGTVASKAGLPPGDTEYQLDQIPYGADGTLGDLVLAPPARKAPAAPAKPASSLKSWNSPTRNTGR